MAFDFAKAFEVFVEAVKNGFSYAERCKKSQSETEVIKDRKKLQKAVDYAEKLIVISGKYHNQFSDEDKEDFSKNFEKFLKYN